MRWVWLLLMAVVLAGACGRTSTTTTNPLAGWKCAGDLHESALNEMRGWTNATITDRQTLYAPPLSRAVMDDCLAFLKTLPVRKDPYGYGDHGQRWFIMTGTVFEDGTGQRAVVLSIPLDGEFLSYILIYDQDGKRVKAVKHSGGHYSS